MTVIIDKNEPDRFLGDGVSFRAKLIGVLEVSEARGDRMCQEALGDLKMAVRAAGEHKQRIQVHVAIDGLRLRDDKTGDSLYHHPVHKISFIAQDMSDSRAFGYIFGSPDTGHRFFGIKTDKAASQVVIAMRDLFQVVFEIKKTEIERAKKQLEEKSSVSTTRHNICLDTNKTKSLINPSGDVSNLKLFSDPMLKLSDPTAPSSSSGGAVAELVDLEQELSSLRRGLHQMEGLTPPSATTGGGLHDPFGDSFTSPPSLTKGLLPPPPSGTSRDGRCRSSISNTPSVTSQPNTSYSPAKSSGILSSAAVGFNPPSLQTATANLEQANETANQKLSSEQTAEQSTSAQQSSLAFDVFMELDPLGTGRSKPYVDKKHFFQELKNPPKKVLKDLVPGVTSLLDASPSVATCLDSALNEPLFGTSHITSLRRQSSGRNPLVPSNSIPSSQILGNMQNNQLFNSDPFAETDPFDSADPFSESLKEDPFLNSPSLGSFRDTNVEFSLAKESSMDINGGEHSPNQKKDENGRVFVFSHKLDGRRQRNGGVFNGPLQVSLPPEQQSPKSPLFTRQTSPHKKHSNLYKQRSLLGKASLYSSHIPSPPPPLPPKPLAAPLEGICLKPPPRPPHSDTEPADSGSETGPPLPNPARRWGTQAPLRVNKPSLSSMTTNSSEDEYLTPIPPSAVKKNAAPGLDMTITQLLTCGLEDLALKMNVPASRLSSMTLAQLTTYLTDFLETSQNNTTTISAPPKTVAPKVQKYKSYPNDTVRSAHFNANFEDNFSSKNATTSSETFVANFDDFNKKLDPSFDRYAVFREIRDEELKVSVPDSPDEAEEQSVNNGAEYRSFDFETKVNNIIPEVSSLSIDDKHIKSRSITPMTEGLTVMENAVSSKSPIPDLQLGSFTAFKETMQKTSPCKTKLEDLKAAINKIQKSEQSSKSPVTAGTNEDINSDRYAALREITIIESSPTDFDIPAVPPEGPKERKRSDEKSDGFDNSDFFDCIDNSSLSLSHAEDAFRRSPMISKSPLPKPATKKEEHVLPPQSSANLMPQPQTPAPNSGGSMSDIVSGSSPETAHKGKVGPNNAGSNDSSGGGDAPAWGAFPKLRSPRSEDAPSPWSSDSKESGEGEGGRVRARKVSGSTGGGGRTSGGDPPPALPRPRRRPPTKSWNTRQTSSSSRDVSPWEEESPPPRSHTRSVPHHRERHGSSKERLESSSNREREKEKRERRDSGSVSGRDRELSRERDHVREWEEHRDDRRRSRERDREWNTDIRDRDREYTRDRDYREPRVTERGMRDKDLHSRDREKDRVHRRQRHHSWVDDEDYSEERSMMGVSGEVSRSASREFRDRWEACPETDERMWPPRRDDRGYNTVGWRGEARRRAEASRQGDNPNTRYSNTLRGRWSSGSRSSRDRDNEPRTQRYSRTSRTSRSPQRESPPRSRRNYRQARSHQSPEEPAKNTPRYRFSNDFSTERESPRSPFENDFVETPCSSSSKKYREDFSGHERESPKVSERGFSRSERVEVIRSPSPVSTTRYEGGRAHALLQNEDSPTPQTGRFRFDSDSVSPRSLFEDDFTSDLRNGSQPPTSRSAEPNLPCNEVIAEEDEIGTKSRASSDKNVGFEVSSIPRTSDTRKSQNKIKPRSRPDPDIKKSESVNIFVRDKDPFDGDDFFCTGSDRAGRRENWPGDFPAFDDV